MLREIEERAAGPRHVVVMAADPRVLELVSSMTGQGLAESTDSFIERAAKKCSVCALPARDGSGAGTEKGLGRGFSIQADGDDPH